MTNPQPDSPDDGSDELEEESAAVQAATDTPTSQNEPTVETTALVEDESTNLAETQDLTDTKDLDETADIGDATSTVADDPEISTDSRRLETEPTKATRRIGWSRLVAFGLLPGLLLVLAVAAGYLKWENGVTRASVGARDESVAAAKDSTTALLSYQPETVEKNLGAARDRLTGTFKDSYTQLTNEVVIPGATQKHISAVAKVPAASSVSATPTHAVVLVFVDQTVVIGTDNPTDTNSSVRVTLDKVDGRWLISGFDPV
jgi:Mce-associated membrane protein